MAYEIEVKLRCNSVEFLTRAGIKLDLIQSRHFEDNWLLDREDQSLNRSACVLRVRRVGQSSSKSSGTITLKARPEADAPKTQFKQRIEIETEVSDADSALQIFERMGYRQWFRYQKYRTVYLATIPPASGLTETHERATLHVMFDETSLGKFVELEGDEGAITQAVKLMGVTPAEYILESYIALQQNHCDEQHKPFEDMLFGASSNVEA